MLLKTKKAKELFQIKGDQQDIKINVVHNSALNCGPVKIITIMEKFK